MISLFPHVRNNSEAQGIVWLMYLPFKFCKDSEPRQIVPVISRNTENKGVICVLLLLSSCNRVASCVIICSFLLLAVRWHNTKKNYPHAQQLKRWFFTRWFNLWVLRRQGVHFGNVVWYRASWLAVLNCMLFECIFFIKWPHSVPVTYPYHCLPVLQIFIYRC